MSTATDDTEQETEKKGGKKLLFIIIGAALVVLIAGGVVAFMLLKPKEPEPDPAKEPGAVVALEDEMTLNLSDGKFLKTQLALQLSEAATTAAGGEEALAKGGFDGSKARDAAITTLSKYSYQQLLKPKTREEAQAALSKEVNERYEGDVLKVYFTQFVMQ
ncbi:flagellar basal body-associated FliL family protein [Agilicoccus flavus]|uniref:flagellar basal body-associated FliL family protein n=1 Tax=Agilicoccus flavus TaxID=2775968 RepID=UPI001CF6391B|nr:flagellar basal body-associated FliL family protein [Agilicoccus flavus]